MMLTYDSMPMQIAKSLGLTRVAWAMRRFHCPVHAEALVLEVGSGGNPYARANVLLDAYEVTGQRHWAPLVSDRPTVLGFVEALPFQDKVFDFVIASHVLEHSSQPERFLAELQRVAKAGYIEVPDAFMERINPYRDHRLEITVRDGALVIRKKPDWRTDPELVELYEHRAKRPVTTSLIPEHPFNFHVRYYWESTIDFTVLNPEVDASWPAPIESGRPVQSHTGFVARLRAGLLGTLRKLLSQSHRNRSIDVRSLLRCPSCSSNAFAFGNQEHLDCQGCGGRFEFRGSIFFMNTAGTTESKVC